MARDEAARAGQLRSTRPIGRYSEYEVMSGHPKWATTKPKQAAIDAKRGKLFAKPIKSSEGAACPGLGDPLCQPTGCDAHYQAMTS